MRCIYDNLGQCSRVIVGDGSVPAFEAGHIVLAIFAIALWDALFRQVCVWFIPRCTLRQTNMQITAGRYIAMVFGVITSNLLIDQDHDLRRIGDATTEPGQQVWQLLSWIGLGMFGLAS